jgi:hypothetical protein
MQRKLCLSLFVAGLFLNACATTVPDIEAVSPVAGISGVAALGQNTNSDTRRRLTVQEWLDFLYARGPVPDPKDPKKTLPAKGPAVCFSSHDYQKNETAIAQLCSKGKCTYEQQKALERIQSFRAATTSR